MHYGVGNLGSRVGAMHRCPATLVAGLYVCMVACLLIFLESYGFYKSTAAKGIHYIIALC
jgi:hypothetical protein